MTLKELDMRESDGLTVTLAWNPAAEYDESISPLIVDVSDSRTGERFQLLCDSGTEGLHAFHHPYAQRDFTSAGQVVNVR